MTNKQLTIGLFGFGNVGRGLYEVLEKSPSTRAQIRKIVVQDKSKTRSIDSDYFSYNADDILTCNEINTVAELIDDDREALKIVETALRNGKNVVSGNKKMIAENLQLLIKLQQQTGSSLLYDASACGSIPIIRNLEEYYDNDLLNEITGILNGSSNYILTQMQKHNAAYRDAVNKAREKGFAESDPTFDVDGYDAMYKLIILTLHGFGTIVSPDNVFFTGISTIDTFDIQFANEKRQKIKLIAKVYKTEAQKIALFVIPAFISKSSYIYNVDGEYNGVIIDGEAYDKQLMFGKGAGSHPTGSAVLSDITALSHNYKYEYKKHNFASVPEQTNDVTIKVYFRYQDPAVPDLLPLQNIEEQYSGTTHHYTIGHVNIGDLISIKEILKQRNVFMALHELK
ncbi:MAG: homoserine dehydrogenase [Salinivirgaceae bacterium]|jgi:homoserine dehydrogenase|nr:homoserine dehydrogenase [Salinivirgaceae bacterium]